MAENKSPSQRWGAPLPIREDTTESRRQRALAGMLYGFLGGSAFALLAGTIDALTYPDLPIYIDWNVTLVRWLWLAPALALLGVLTAWPLENLKGIGSGAVILAMTILGVSVYQSMLSPLAKIVTFIILGLPVTALCAPVAWTLRWLVSQHILLARGKSAPVRLRSITLLILLALVLGMLPTVLLRASGKAESALRTVDTQLQNARAGKFEKPFSLPVEKMPALKAHLPLDYHLIQHSSIFSTEGFDVTILFADNYKVTCVLVVYGSQKPYISGCVEGEKIVRH